MAIVPVPVTARKVHVYELSNRTRQENLLVLTSAPSADVVARLRREPPPEAGLWRLHDDVAVEILAQDMAETAAEQFLKMHLEHMQRRAQRFHVWRV